MFLYFLNCRWVLGKVNPLKTCGMWWSNMNHSVWVWVGGWSPVVVWKCLPHRHEAWILQLQCCIELISVRCWKCIWDWRWWHRPKHSYTPDFSEDGRVCRGCQVLSISLRLILSVVFMCGQDRSEKCLVLQQRHLYLYGISAGWALILFSFGDFGQKNTYFTCY